MVLSFLAEAANSSELTGASYTNVIIPSEPWSIHVVKVDRAGSGYEIQSQHAGGGALGLSTLRDQVAAVNSGKGVAVAAINGGFYRRDSAYAGGARGLQIVAGEVISAPTGNASFWIDIGGEPHLTNVTSQFQITIPDGKVMPVGLNEERTENGIVLYTPVVGASTRTTNGLELVLERQTGSRWSGPCRRSPRGRRSVPWAGRHPGRRATTPTPERTSRGRRNPSENRFATDRQPSPVQRISRRH